MLKTWFLRKLENFPKDHLKGFIVLLHNLTFLPSADILLWKSKKEHRKGEYDGDMYKIGFVLLADSRQATQRKLRESNQKAGTGQEIRGATLQVNF